MGRPWWYDSYWDKQKKPKRRIRFPGGPVWIWIILLAVVAGIALIITLR